MSNTIEVPPVGMSNAIRGPLVQLVEAVDQIVSRLDKIDGRLDKIDDRLDRIEIDVKGCKDKIDVLTTRLNTLTFVARTEGHEAAEDHARKHQID